MPGFSSKTDICCYLLDKKTQCSGKASEKQKCPKIKIPGEIV